MTYIQDHITQLVKQHFAKDYQLEVPGNKIVVTETKDDFEGDFTLVVFPLAGMARKKPEAAAEEIGASICQESSIVMSYNVVKGFLNLTCSNDFWLHELERQTESEVLVPQIGCNKIVLEYCSPNSNKPLHLGHVRNVLLGWSVGQILMAVGHDVHYTQVVNDRGIAICKSMLAWEKFGNGETPASTGMKSDHFVGHAYVQFNTELEKEYTAWKASVDADQAFENRKNKEDDRDAFFKSYKNDYFNQHSSLGKETREMLVAWENNNPTTRALWQKLNDWFMAGFLETSARLGIHFDSMNYESDTYLLGKDIVQDGLAKGIFYQEDDKSIWIDLTDDGLDKKLVLRGDGTSVYITQDLGTARTRYADYQMDGMIYTVGNEQNYHFQALFKTLAKLGESYADNLFHLSYGMVDLPSGRMKTREGTVVDADVLIDEVIDKVKQNSAERGELDMLSMEEKDSIIETIGIGALKYYMLRVDAKKRMLFNPEESVDLQGQTGPYIQNAFVRIQSIMRRLKTENIGTYDAYSSVNKEEKQVLKTVMNFGNEIVSSSLKHDPSVVASYAYQLARVFHRFYHDHSIAKAESGEAKAFRFHLAKTVADRLKRSMKLLGIDMPERM